MSDNKRMEATTERSAGQAKLAAEAEKLVAETKKLQAETEAMKNASLATASEWIKIVAGVILGLGGLVAAVTQYQISEVKKENAALAVKLAEQDKVSVERQIKEAVEILNEHRARVLASLAEIQEEPYEPLNIGSPEHRWLKVLRRLEAPPRDPLVAQVARMEVGAGAERYSKWVAAKILRVAKSHREAQVAARFIAEKRPQLRSTFDQLFMDVVNEASGEKDWTRVAQEMARGWSDATAPLVFRVHPLAAIGPQPIRYVRYELYSSKQDEDNGNAFGAYISIQRSQGFEIYVVPDPAWGKCSALGPTRGGCYVTFTGVSEAGDIVALGRNALHP